MTTRREIIQEHYKKIEGELHHLPNKRWKTNSEYVKDFSFIKNKNLLKQISKHKMSFDYLVSLYELHKPLGPIQEIHFLLLCQMVGSMCEAMMRDLLYYRIDTIDNKNTANMMTVKFSRPMLKDLIEILGGSLSQGDKKYLGDVKKLRDAIHLNKEIDSIKYIQDTGHLITEKIKDDFLGGIFIKKKMNIEKLISEFDLFYKQFLKYYK